MNHLTFNIQESLLEDLTLSLEKYNQVNDYKLKLDVAVFFLSLFNSIPSFYRQNMESNNVSLNSERLKKYHSRYSFYFVFFQKEGYIIKVQNHSSDNRFSRVYRVSEKYSKDELKSYMITDKCLSKKFDSRGRDSVQLSKNHICENQRPHLTKFFNESLTINYWEARNETEKLFSNEQNKGRYYASLVVLDEFKNQNWKYSIKPKTDNRFHTNITRLPSFFRKYLRYNNEPLVALDLKTSQPFFLCVIIKAIIKKDKRLLDKINANLVLNDKVIQELFDLELNKDELVKFLFIVLNKDLYDEFAKELEVKYNGEGLPFRVVSNYNNANSGFQRRVFDIKRSPTRIKTYESERDLSKNVIMEIFYSKPNSTIREAKVFREIYCSIYKIFKCLNDNDVKLWRLLQNVEAFVLLDHVAKTINKKYPEMPLFSIHDSLITTEQWEKKLKREMLREIKLLTSLIPNVEIEYWSNIIIKEVI
jgi:hypothetical protein